MSLLHDISWVVPLRSELLTPIFHFFTWLGYSTSVMLILALGYWLWSKEKFTRVAILVLVSTIINAFLKDLWENPRPDLVFQLDAQVGESFGMPSGHAQVSAVLWFWIAYEVRKTWAWITAAVVVSGICFSRIYLGIHDLEDIFAGLAIAVISLFAFRLLLALKLQPLIDAPLMFWLVAILVSAVIVRLAWPSAEHSIGAISVFGLLFSWCIGAKIEPNLLAFSPQRTVWGLVLLGVIGVVGLMILLAALKPILDVFDPLVAATINAVVIGFYVTLMAPMLFKLCKLSVQP